MSPQSHAAEITSASFLKPDSGAAEAEFAGATRDLHLRPMSKPLVQEVRQFYTLRPLAESDPDISKTFLDPQDTRIVKTHSQLNEWQAPISSEAASEIQASSRKQRPECPRSLQRWKFHISC